MRSVQVEHVWISADGRTQIRIRTRLPLIREGCAVDTLQSHIGHATCGDVKAGSKGDDIELMLDTVRGSDALLGKLGDFSTIGSNVDNVDVVLVKDFVVILLEAGTLWICYVR